MIVNFGSLAFFALGLSSADPRLHALLASVIPVVIAVAVFPVMGQPDALVRPGP